MTIASANNYQMSKWRQWFDVLDVNKDGVLSHSDTDISKDTFALLHHLDAAQRDTMGANIESWWKDHVLRGKEGEISQQNFVDDLAKDLSAGADKFRTKVMEEFRAGFAIIDINSDGFISEDEFIVMFKALGHKDETMMRKMFQSLGPKDGLIDVQAMADAWTDFLTNADSSVASPIKTALDTEIK